MPTVEELLAKCEELKQGALALLAEVKKMLAESRAMLEQERDEDQKIIDLHLDKEARGKKAGVLARRAAKKQKALNLMTHNERLKELSSKSANMSVLVYKAERDEEEDDKRIKSLLALVTETENQELAEDIQHGQLLEELEKAVASLKTDPREISRLNPAGQRENLQAWARIHAILQRLDAVSREKYLMQGRLRRLREELMPLLAKETETDTKVERVLAWLKDVDEMERKTEEEEEHAATGEATMEELKEAA